MEHITASDRMQLHANANVMLPWVANLEGNLLFLKWPAMFMGDKMMLKTTLRCFPESLDPACVSLLLSAEMRQPSWHAHSISQKRGNNLFFPSRSGCQFVKEWFSSPLTSLPSSQLIHNLLPHCASAVLRACLNLGQDTESSSSWQLISPIKAAEWKCSMSSLPAAAFSHEAPVLSAASGCSHRPLLYVCTV